MELVDAGPTSPSRPIDSEASASSEYDPFVVAVLLVVLSFLDCSAAEVMILYERLY
jgi:hypothetical protein